MSNYLLPAHEFFIYVSAKSKQQSLSYVPSVELKSAEATFRPSEHAEAPAKLQTWTRLQVADALDIYACL
ncbi:hypothetical protein KDW_29350 [Dictyobacter vulcani]|uniref:Uncharacterized protein n=1 Tax=Dictyobacter vulcani TaxID=2607529 RepID=A0A5J4KLV8_9CHLR|nr:hypothetical protein [Dictyobacter vulcani]GER88773.1 hypothetical protein KDW_29350 [Dictyobacter vulcani]